MGRLLTTHERDIGTEEPYSESHQQTLIESRSEDSLKRDFSAMGER